MLHELPHPRFPAYPDPFPSTLEERHQHFRKSARLCLTLLISVGMALMLGGALVGTLLTASVHSPR